MPHRHRRLFGICGALGVVACLSSSQPKPVVPATTPPAPAGVNPFAGARLYGDPDFATMVEGLAARTPEHAAALKKVAGYPTAVWLETVEMAKSTSRWLDDALRQQGSTGQPVVPVF